MQGTNPSTAGGEIDQTLRENKKDRITLKLQVNK